MQTAARLSVCLLMVTSSFSTTTAYHISPKLRRDGVLSLYPQPRVGRASHHTWDPPINVLHDYFDKSSEQEQFEKRQLYAFPRVGRTDPRYARARNTALLHHAQDPYLRYGRLDPALDNDQIEMPVRRTDSPGMWFGPRLGRAFQSDDDDISIESENNNQRESQPSRS